LNGRSFDNLILLNVGVSNATSNTLDGGAWNMFSVAGKRPETNRYTINGVDWVGGSATGQFITPNGASRQLLGVEAVREFNVLSDTYGADYGKRAGGQITIVTASGTNQVHGSAFEFCVTTPWMPATFSITPLALLRTDAINLEGLWEARSRRTRCSCTGPMKGLAIRYRVR